MVTLLTAMFFAAQAPLSDFDLRPNNSTIESIVGGLSVVYHPNEWPNVTYLPKSPWDWSHSRGLAFDVHNPGKDSVILGVRFDDDPGADGWHH